MKNEDKIESCRRAAPRLAHAAFLLLFLACGAVHAFVIAPYFPLGNGAVWTYQTNDASGTHTMVRVVAGTALVNGVTVTVLQDSNGEQHYYTNDADGIRQHGIKSNVPVSPGSTITVTEIDSPPQVQANAETTLGETVTSGGTATFTYPTMPPSSFPLSYLVTSTPQAFETVSVPAGTFINALRIRTVTRVFGTISGPNGSASVDITQDETDWLVSGVGVVSATSSTSSMTNGVSDGPPEVGTAVLISSFLADFVPDEFFFRLLADAPLATIATSNTITVSGITVPTSISVFGGQYSIDGGAYTSASGTISKGQSVTVQLVSAATLNTTTSAILTIGGISATFRVTTQLVPSAPGAPSNATATAGNAQATVTFAPPPSNGGAAITGYTVTSSPAGGIDSNAGTTSTSHLITGLTNGTSYTFTVTATNSVGTGPASASSNAVMPAFAFSLTLQTGVAVNSVTSSVITVLGLAGPSPISITGGVYSVNGATYTSAAGTVNNGDTVTVQLTSSSKERTQACATLTIGGVSGQFCVTTLATPSPNLLQILDIIKDD